MQITRSSIATGTGSAEWFTGQVYFDTVTSPTAPSRLQAASVRFTPERADRLARPPTSSRCAHRCRGPQNENLDGAQLGWHRHEHASGPSYT
jgi:hypothetical protein